MTTAWTGPERRLLFACAALLMVALLGPHVAQPAHAHDFADQRTLAGVPCALDVLSNLPFALAGLVGLWILRRAAPSSLRASQRSGAFIFFVGLLLAAAGSAGYHLTPDDTWLAVDRACMGVAFAGLLGLLAASRISDRAGIALAGALLVLAPAAVMAWMQTGNVLPWALVQFGGMALVLGVLATTRPLDHALPVRWGWVLIAYAVAKLFEMGDQIVYTATGELLSGHTIKHLVAALAAWPVIAGIADVAQRQNCRQPATQVA